MFLCCRGPTERSGLDLFPAGAVLWRPFYVPDSGIAGDVRPLILTVLHRDYYRAVLQFLFRTVSRRGSNPRYRFQFLAFRVFREDAGCRSWHGGSPDAASILAHFFVAAV